MGGFDRPRPGLRVGQLTVGCAHGQVRVDEKSSLVLRRGEFNVIQGALELIGHGPRPGGVVRDDFIPEHAALVGVGNDDKVFGFFFFHGQADALEDRGRHRRGHDGDDRQHTHDFHKAEAS